MGMGKKLAAGAAVLAVLAAAGALLWGYLPPKQASPVTASLQTGAETVEEWKNVIAYVPLDDRTDNMEDVVYLAEASGYRVVMPEGDVYCTKLDGQTPNQNGTPYGDREALFTWVREMDEAGCDLFVLSLDQLFSGGLVNSRSVSQAWPLTFPDGTRLTEEEAFREYILSLSRDPDNRVYLFDSVVRLSPTVGYRGFDVEEYYGLREYGMVARPELTGEALTMENIFAAYPYAADGVTPAEDALGSDKFRSAITPEILEEYLGVRRRKLTLLDGVITAMESAPGGQIQLLIGIDDSSNTTNIQYNELSYLQKRLGPDTALMAGLDSLARLLVGRIAQERYDYSVQASVRYIGGTEERPSSEFDRYTLSEVVDLHMDLFRARRTAEEDAELQILIMTAPDVPEKAADYCEELVSRLEENLKHRVPTVLIEASNDAYGDALEQALLARVPFGELVAFAGKYDQANVTGAAFAMGFSRYLYLRCCEEKSDGCDLAQVRQMANSMLLTEYILHARTPLNQFIQKLGVNYNNILAAPGDRRRIQGKLEELLAGDTERVCANLSGADMLTDLDPWGEKTVDTVSVSDLYFPWNRTFELSFTVHAALKGT